jgi:3-oxoacyl-[acyl-carrier-protein] synthase II
MNMNIHSDDIVPDIDCKIVGIVPSREQSVHGFDLDAIVPIKDQKKMGRFIQFGLEAARQAIKQAAWEPTSDGERERTATIIASGIGGFSGITNAARIVEASGAKRLSPFTVPGFLINLAAGHISIRHGFRGPIGAPVTACAASVQAIGDGLRMIHHGEADVVVCGGTEACIDRVSLGAFAMARTLSTGFNDRPTEASRPFDSARDGFVMAGVNASVIFRRWD